MIIDASRILGVYILKIELYKEEFVTKKCSTEY